MLSGILIALLASPSACSYEQTPATEYVAECKPGTTRPCGTNLGGCTTGLQACGEGSWGTCSGKSPAVEVCDGMDNDCDGDVDEGFGVGAECSLPGQCPGHRVCSSEDSHAVVCEVDEGRRSAEICDGIDNDCDGLVDFTRTASGLKPACGCERTSIAFVNPADRSIDQGAHLCATTSCSAVGGGLGMDFCLECGKGDPLPYAMCENGIVVDLSSFDGSALGDRFLEVSFTFTSEMPVLTPINLYYLAGGRKYLPLLKSGEAAGSYTKVFYPGSGCFPQDNTFNAPGSICKGDKTGGDCPGCVLADSCGLGIGCAPLKFSASLLQVAAEFCPGGVSNVAGTLRLQKVSLISIGCLAGPP